MYALQRFHVKHVKTAYVQVSTTTKTSDLRVIYKKDLNQIIAFLDTFFVVHPHFITLFLMIFP